MRMTKTETAARAAKLQHSEPLIMIDERALDMTSDTFRERLFATGISTHQFARITDITRGRLRRICEGEQKSLVERAPGTFVVPRHFAIILLAIEAGLLVKGEESL